MSGYIMDTSVLVAAEQDRPLPPAPSGSARISVATLTELLAGVRRAPDDDVRAVRTEMLDRARRFVALPFDERVAEPLADILSAARTQGRRAGAMDAIIAATAIAHDLAVWSADGDFAVLAELAPDLRVVSAQG